MYGTSADGLGSFRARTTDPLKGPPKAAVQRATGDGRGCYGRRSWVPDLRFEIKDSGVFLYKPSIVVH